MPSRRRRLPEARKSQRRYATHNGDIATAFEARERESPAARPNERFHVQFLAVGALAARFGMSAVLAAMYAADGDVPEAYACPLFEKAKENSLKRKTQKEKAKSRKPKRKETLKKTRSPNCQAPGWYRRSDKRRPPKIRNGAGAIAFASSIVDESTETLSIARVGRSNLCY
jgi:hypothetical protein